MKICEIVGITPLESPDVSLALHLQKAGAFPVLHLGRDKDIAAAAVNELAAKLKFPFGVCFVCSLQIEMPPSVSLVIAPYGLKVPVPPQARLFYQVHNPEEATMAAREGAGGIIVKGNEGAGTVSDDTSFILFQRIIREAGDMEVWVQGGIGIHSAAAMAALGAGGIVLDSQLILFDQCSAPAEVKKLCSRLSGNETRVIDHVRVLVRPNSPVLPDMATRSDLEKWFGPMEVDKGYLPLGQDIAIAQGLVKRYKKLTQLVFGLKEAIYGHLRQAQTVAPLAPGNALARELNIRYPIAQGPMTRVSDVPALADAVANAGGLPFIALSLMRGEHAREVIRQTRQLAGDKTWGVGILGFTTPELLEEQITCLLEERPPVVLIAGGRPSQAKRLEQQGIKVFLHVPSVSLLDMFIKEGARRFVFEGRECGGHVGPLSSLVLWESQIERLLQEDEADAFSVLFAGGIHDAVSAAIVAVMAAPLATKGARLGVLMGTAYLYTKEVVTTGAITAQFQQQAIAHTGTVLLETAPGHETRCLDTPFAGYFKAEKENLRKAGVDKQEIWTRLESLNVGRLRIAAKGIERQGETLVPVAEDAQLTDGMYMIGQAAALNSHVVSIAALHKAVAEGNIACIRSAPLSAAPRQTEGALDIAIVGMACIFPGARNIDEYWRNIITGRDTVTEVPDERWNKQLYYDPNSNGGERSASKWGGFLPVTDFDPVEFGIPPQSLAAIEPAQLLSLLVAREALRNAGYADKEFDRDNVSVIIAADGGYDLSNNYNFRSLYPQIFGEIPAELDAALPRLTEDSFPGVLANVISGRISNRLDLGGRNYSVDAACASSLAAVDVACQELQLGKSDMVLAGAVDLHNSIIDYLLFSSTKALSKTGRCKTFDSAADGIALGEGVAVLVLKRHEDAIREGDKIFAVIRGIGGSSDGKSLGLTAPRKRGQWKALERAYAQSGLSAAGLGLVEAHGTGTVVGDKTELSALSDLLIQSGAIPGQTTLGSVKTQIGHTKCAAGLAGLIKATLSVYHGIKPPTLHLADPNRYYKPENNPFVFNTEAAPWLERTRVAGISAFGFGGTNFHVVIENETQGNPDTGSTYDTAIALKSWPSELFVFRGDNYEEARHQLGVVRTILLHNDKIEGRDLAYSLALYCKKTVQLVIIAEHAEDLLLKVNLALSGAATEGIYIAGKKEGKVAFLFPGQGSQRVNMARSLFTVFPSFRRLLNDNVEYARILFPSTAFGEDALQQQKESIKDTCNAQPLLGMVDLAIACFLKDLGIKPDMVAGHSYGELPALCFAGVFSPEDLVPLSEKRARAILAAAGEDKGGMLAVNCPPEMLREIASEESGVYPVNHNSPHQWVLAGSTPALNQVAEKLKALKISFRPLEVACAFHSPLLAGAESLFAEALEDVPFCSPSLPVWSNTTASPYPSDPAAIRDRLAEHLVKPVRFSEEIADMYEHGARIFLEVGPGRTLSALTKSILGKEEMILHTEDKDGVPHLLRMLAQYICSGRELQLAKLFTGREAKIIDLDKPEQYKRKATVWFVNGQAALPSTGKLPPSGARPIVTPLAIVNRSSAAQPPADTPAERVMEEYLSSIKSLIQAQRDVVLSYFGRPPSVSSPAPAPGRHELPAAVNVLPAAVRNIASPPVRDTPSKADGSDLPVENGVPDGKHILLGIVSDKTGYPVELLGLNMDMEAELSIDSIKRIEIIGELRNQLSKYGHGREKLNQLTEKATGMKTLQGLLDLLSEQPNSKANEALNSTATEQLKSTAAVAPAAKKEKLGRWRFELTQTGLEGKDAALLKGKHFAITNDSEGVAAAIKTTLERNSASATIITAADALDSCDGLIILDMLNYPGRRNIMDSFSMIKKLDLAKVKWVYAVAATGLVRHFQGYPGFLKSLAREWENTFCRTIHLNTGQLPEGIADIVLDELLHSGDLTEVLYQGMDRQTMNPVPSELTIGDASGLHLDASSVVLVLGGAQGITAELMIRFAREYPCKYVLVGRSPDPRNAGADAFAALDNRDDIRQLLIRQSHLKKAVDIEKRTEEIYKQNQILRTITALENNGATVAYHSLDLRDGPQLGLFVDSLYKDYGHIDGIVHGAGILEDKLFEDKTPESFERVFSTKVTPLRVLEERLRDDVQFVVLFSSVASVYGNRGQTDYAAANSVLDKYAWELNKKIKGKVVAINWGPWKGTGMVSPALEREYERRGIPLIPLTAGWETFLNELKYGNDSEVLIMAE